MVQLQRRGLLAGGAAALLGVPPLRAAAQDLPRRYAGTVLNVLSRTSPAFDATVRAAEAFSDATGIRVQHTRIAPSDQYAKLMLDVSGNTNSFDVTLFIYPWKLDVAPFLADLSTLERDVPGAPALALDDYPPALLEIYGKAANRLVGLPVVGDVSFLLRNTDRYREAGLNPAAAPESWEEVAGNGRLAMREGRYGYALPAGKTPQCYVTWTILFNAFGGRYLSPDGEPDLAGAAGLRAMETMAGALAGISPPGNLTWDYNEVLNSFSTGQSAQAIMWPGGFAALSDPARSAVAGRFAMSPPPGGSLLGGTSIGVNAKSRNPEAARLFVAWMCSREVVARNAADGTPPARLSALAEPSLVERFPHFPAVRQSMLGPTYGYIPVREAEQILVMTADEANAACAGTKSPRQAADDLQRKATQFLRRRGHIR